MLKQNPFSLRFLLENDFVWKLFFDEQHLSLKIHVKTVFAFEKIFSWKNYISLKHPIYQNFSKCKFEIFESCHFENDFKTWFSFSKHKFFSFKTFCSFLRIHICYCKILLSFRKLRNWFLKTLFPFQEIKPFVLKIHFPF